MTRSFQNISEVVKVFQNGQQDLLGDKKQKMTEVFKIFWTNNEYVSAKRKTKLQTQKSGNTQQR